MTRKTIFMTGAAAATLAAGLALSTPALANPIPQATSYADLFQPVNNAPARLAADDAAQFQAVQDWRYRDRGYGNRGFRDEHHHHHQRYDRRYYESRGYYWNGWEWARRPVYHHHHHHHHHSYDGGWG